MGILEILMAQDRDAELAKKNKAAYQPLLRQLPTTAAAAVGPLLSAEDAGAQQQGMSLLAEYLRRNSPEARQDMAIGEGQLSAQRLAEQSQRFNNMLAANQEQRTAAAFPLEQQGRRQGNQLQQLQITGQQLTNQGLQAPPPMPTDAQLFEQETGYPLPKDYIPGLNPNTGRLEPIPAPNTPAAIAATKEIDAAERLSKTVTRFLALVDAAGATGTEMWGPRAGALRQAREDVITAYRERAALGTPTGQELTRIEEILPDPTSYGRNYYGSLVAGATLGFGADYMKQTMTAPYQDLLQTITADLDTKYKRNWWVPPSPQVRAP